MEHPQILSELSWLWAKLGGFAWDFARSEDGWVPKMFTSREQRPLLAAERAAVRDIPRV